MSSLPPEIITTILIRLPVKSLLRFRCVSKPWCAEIDSPDFIKLHHTHSITTGSNLSIITESEGTLYSLDSDSLKNLVRIEIPFINPAYTTSLSSTCNSLLLLQNYEKYLFKSCILFNPSTRKHHVLPTPPQFGITSCVAFSILGYDVINDDYKVFNVGEFVDQAHNFIASEARIYSLKSNLWHVVKDFTKEAISDFIFEAYVNGTLHAVNDKDYKSIVAIDVGKEIVNLVPMPNFEDKSFSYSLAHVFDGCLTVLCIYPDNRTDIWVMKEYAVKESWSMLFSVKLKPVDPNRHLLVMTPLVYSNSRAEVLLSCNGRQLVWYELRNKTFRDVEVSGFTGYHQVCVESLVSVGITGKTDEKKQHEEEK